MIGRWGKRLLLGGMLSLLLAPDPARACAVCFGTSDSPLAKGMNMGIFALLLVVFFVLAALTAFFIFLARRAKAVGAEAALGDSNATEVIEDEL